MIFLSSNKKWIRLIKDQLICKGIGRQNKEMSVTAEECEEMRRFYKPYLEKYESKYRILYQMLQQANRQMGQTGLLSIQEPTSGITPSLAVLDDAQALRRKEWKRDEPGEDIPRQHSTVSRHLTPTQPKHEDIRMDSMLNVTPEGSLSDLPSAVGGVEESRREQEAQQTPEKEIQDVCPSSNIVTFNRRDFQYLYKNSTWERFE